MENSENDLLVFYARALQNALSLSQSVRWGAAKQEEVKVDSRDFKKRSSGNSTKRTDANVHI